MQAQSVTGTSNFPAGLLYCKYVCTVQGLFEMFIRKLRAADTTKYDEQFRSMQCDNCSVFRFPKGF